MMWQRDGSHQFFEAWILEYRGHSYKLMRLDPQLIVIEVDGFFAARFVGDRARIELAKEYTEKFIIDAPEEKGD